MIKDLDLKLLEIFCCIYEEGSLINAAEKMYISQSTLSFHIKNLENRLGQRLFYRKGKKLVPTPLADKLYSYAKEIKNLKRKVIEDLSKYTGEGRGILRIGASSIPGNYIIPQILGTFKNEFNGHLEIELEVSDSLKVYKGVIEGKYDFGIIGFHPNDDRMEIKKLHEDQIRIASNPGIKQKVYSLEELKNLPLVVREKGSGTRRKVEEQLNSKGLSLKDMNVIATFSSNSAIISFLDQVEAYTFMSSIVLRQNSFLVTLTVIDFPPITRSFYLIKTKDRELPSTASEFWNFLLKGD